MTDRLNILVMLRENDGVWIRYFNDYKKALAYYRVQETHIGKTMVNRPIPAGNIRQFDSEEDMNDFAENMSRDYEIERHLFMYKQKNKMVDLEEMGIYTVGYWKRKYCVNLHIVQADTDDNNNANNSIYSSIF